MKNPLIKKFIPAMIFYISINVLILIFKSFLIRNGFDYSFILIANSILFLLSYFSFLIQMKGANSSNVNAFIRGLYSSLLIKMFVIIAVIFIYIYMTDGKVNTPALFTSMAIYLIYTSIEVIQLMKIARRKPNA